MNKFFYEIKFGINFYLCNQLGLAFYLFISIQSGEEVDCLVTLTSSAVRGTYRSELGTVSAASPLAQVHIKLAEKSNRYQTINSDWFHCNNLSNGEISFELKKNFLEPGGCSIENEIRIHFQLRNAK